MNAQTNKTDLAELRSDIERLSAELQKAMELALDSKDSALAKLRELEDVSKLYTKLSAVNKTLHKKTPKPRQRRQMLAPGHFLTTVDGSLYNCIITAAAKLGHLANHKAIFTTFKQSAGSERDCQRLIDAIKVADWELEGLVRADPSFIRHAVKMTTFYKTRAAMGDEKAIQVMANPKVFDVENKVWKGDFEEAYGVLKQGWTPKHYSRRNVRILANANLLFDVLMDEGLTPLQSPYCNRHFVLYPVEYFDLYMQAKASLFVVEKGGKWPSA
jgi:hypothetical protein